MGSRADNRDGSCREILTGPHKGKWRVQYGQVNELGQQRRLSRLFRNKSEGKTFLQGLQRGTRVESAKQSKGTTLSNWFDWLSENDWPESLAERTIHCRKARFERYVRKVWGDVPLMKIDPLVVRSFYRSLRDQDVGLPTILEIKRDLVRVFNQAISPYQRVPMTVANPFKLTVDTPPRRDAVALTPEMAKAALCHPKLDPERRAMLAIFLLAGVRLSEQMAMTREQLLFDPELILIDRSVKFGSTGTQTIGLPKGNKTRLAVMCPSLKQILKEFVQDMPPDRVIWSATSENKPRMKKLVYATWRTILNDTELPSGMTIHDCRLTHINWIEKLMSEVSPTTLKEHVGHANQGVTQINYTRPLTTAQKLLRDNLERVVGTKVKGEQTPGAVRVGKRTARAGHK